MINNVINTLNFINGATPVAVNSNFCPIYHTLEEAIRFVYGLEDVEAIGKSVEDKSITIIKGSEWIYAVIPVDMVGYRYYEVVLGACRANEYAEEYRRMIREKHLMANTGIRQGLVECMKTFKGAVLNDKSYERVLGIEVDVDGNIYGDRGIKSISKRYKTAERKDGYYTTYLNITINGVKQHKVSHLVYAAYMGIQLDTLKLLTVPLSLLPEYKVGNIEDEAIIRELRYKGVMFHIDHIDNNTANNAIWNLQLCTATANYKLRMLRNSDFRMIEDR